MQAFLRLGSKLIHSRLTAIGQCIAIDESTARERDACRGRCRASYRRGLSNRHARMRRCVIQWRMTTRISPGSFPSQREGRDGGRDGERAHSVLPAPQPHPNPHPRRGRAGARGTTGRECRSTARRCRRARSSDAAGVLRMKSRAVLVRSPPTWCAGRSEASGAIAKCAAWLPRPRCRHHSARAGRWPDR